jgi:hypothetical protein
VFQSSQHFSDIPYGSYFLVEANWDVRGVAKEGQLDRCKVEATLGISFIKDTFWKGKIESGARKDCTTVFGTWPKVAKPYLSKAVAQIRAEQQKGGEGTGAVPVPEAAPEPEPESEPEPEPEPEPESGGEGIIATCAASVLPVLYRAAMVFLQAIIAVVVLLVAQRYQTELTSTYDSVLGSYAKPVLEGAGMAAPLPIQAGHAAGSIGKASTLSGDTGATSIEERAAQLRAQLIEVEALMQKDT